MTLGMKALTSNTKTLFFTLTRSPALQGTFLEILGISWWNFTDIFFVEFDDERTKKVRNITSGCHGNKESNFFWELFSASIGSESAIDWDEPVIGDETRWMYLNFVEREFWYLIHGSSYVDPNRTFDLIRNNFLPEWPEEKIARQNLDNFVLYMCAKFGYCSICGLRRVFRFVWIPKKKGVLSKWMSKFGQNFFFK